MVRLQNQFMPPLNENILGEPSSITREKTDKKKSLTKRLLCTWVQAGGSEGASLSLVMDWFHHAYLGHQGPGTHHHLFRLQRLLVEFASVLPASSWRQSQMPFSHLSKELAQYLLDLVCNLASHSDKMVYLSFISSCCEKILHQEELKWERVYLVHNSGLSSFMADKSRWQKLEATGHHNHQQREMY